MKNILLALLLISFSSYSLAQDSDDSQLLDEETMVSPDTSDDSSASEDLEAPLMEDEE